MVLYIYLWKLQPVAFISAFGLSEKWKNIFSLI